MDTIAHQLSEEGVPVHTTLSLTSPAEGIANQAELEHIDLIVMTTHGRTGLASLLHPSVTWQVLTKTFAPLLAWRGSDCPAHSPSFPLFMSDAAAPILVPLDGSLPAESALPYAEALAHLFGNPLVLVRATELVMKSFIRDVVIWGHTMSGSPTAVLTVFGLLSKKSSREHQLLPWL